MKAQALGEIHERRAVVENNQPNVSWKKSAVGKGWIDKYNKYHADLAACFNNGRQDLIHAKIEALNEVSRPYAEKTDG